MAAIMSVNPKAELARAAAALELNISGARGLEEVMRSNLGPKGTLKMLVSGSGDIKLTKDGNVLLKEMQIQHPTASLIARASTAQDDIIGDGTTSTVLLIGELLKQADSFVSEGVHPRVLVEGIELAKKRALEVLDKISVTRKMDRETLLNVARTSLRTKVKQDLADHLTECIVDAVLTIHEEGKPLDLFMIEIMEMTQKTDMDTTFVKGIVMDHGARHPDMKKNVTNAFILTCNVGLEYEKTEVNSGFFYKSAAEREKLVAAERDYIDQRVTKIIEMKRKVCDEETAKDGKDRGFVIINQKGIDPPSLDKLAKAGIMALRRAKRRNMERLTKACGGVAVNSVDDLTPDVLGYAGSVYEHTLGEDKFTFVEDCKEPKSVTLLIKGPNKHTITQIKDAIHDGLHAVKNAFDDGKIVPGAAAFEIAVYMELLDLKRHTRGRTSLGIQAFADAMMIVPKVLAQNAGFDPMETILKLQAEASRAEQTIGLDINTGEALIPADAGIWDNFIVKKQQINTFVGIGTNLLLVDEVMRAGMSSLKG